MILAGHRVSDSRVSSIVRGTARLLVCLAQNTGFSPSDILGLSLNAAAFYAQDPSGLSDEGINESDLKPGMRESALDRFEGFTAGLLWESGGRW